MTRTLSWLAVGAFVLAGCQGAPKEEADAPAKAVPVEVVTARVSSVPMTVEAFGTLIVPPDQIAVVSSSSGGRVTGVLAHVGDCVSAGQVLLRLQPDPTIAADLAKARIAAQLSRRSLARERALVAAGISAATRQEDAQSACESAEADLKLKETAANLAAQGTEVRAPRAGVITEAAVSVGMVLPPQAPAMTLSDLSSLGAEVAVAAEALPRVRPGQSATVTLDSGERLAARVVAINRVLAADTQRGSVRLTLLRAPKQAQPQQFVRASLAVGTRRAVLVPSGAVVVQEGNKQVYLVRGDQAHARIVETAELLEGRRALLSGVKAGDQVITRGAYELSEGARVRVVPASRP